MELVREVGRGLLSDGDDTLNNVRVPSLEKDEEAAGGQEEPGETEPLLIRQASSLIGTQHER